MNVEIIEITIRLVVAMILGGIIGLERDYRAKDAGFRTHFLVAVGSALFTLISMYGFIDGIKDSSRVAAQVVSGIGFLGAGLIVLQKNVIRGLTTAAGLWVTAAVGMACGTGKFYMAALTTGLMLVGLEILSHFVPRLGGLTIVHISFSSPSHDAAHKAMQHIRTFVEDVVTYDMKSKTTSHGNFYEVHCEVKMKRKSNKNKLVECLKSFDEVTIATDE